MGQLFSDNSIMAECVLSPLRGRGTDGGLVVHLNAAKYRQRAGPGQERKFLNTAFL